MSWKPIETAPKNGDEFLAYGSYIYPGDNTKTEYQMIVWYRTDAEFMWTDGDEAMGPSFFTHWQPLPEPPSELPHTE